MLPGTPDRGDGVLDVAGQAEHRLLALRQADHEDDGRLGGQLDLDVVGAAQGVGQLVAGAAGATDVEHEPQRVEGRRAGDPLGRSVDHLYALDRGDLLAGRAAGLERLVEKLLTVDGQLAPGCVERHLEDRARAGGAGDPHAARDLVLGDVVALAEVEHRALGERAGELVGARQDRVGAEVESALGKLGVEAEVGTPRLVDDERHPGGVGDLGAAGHVGTYAVVGGRDDEGGAGPGGLLQRLGQALRSDPVRHPPLGVVLRSDEGRDAAAQDQPVDDRGVGVALGDHRGTERREGQRQDVVSLRRPVGEEPGPLCAVGLGGQALGLLERRRARAAVDSVHVGRHVEQEGVLTQRVQEARVRTRPALVAGHREAGRAPEAEADHRVQVGSGRLLGVGAILAQPVAPAERRSSARTNSSRSPPRTRWTSPTSTSVRWSLTIE